MHQMRRAAGITLIIGIVLNLSFCSKQFVWQDFSQLKLPSSPNRYLICIEPYCQIKPDQISPVLEYDIHHLSDNWKKVIANEPRLQCIEEHIEPFEFLYVQRSKWFRFPDIIQVKLIPLENNQSTILLYSRSIYGYYDFDVNRLRLQKWIKHLTEIQH